MANDKKYVHLNVGGTHFMTSRSTITKSTPPNSPLHRISSNSTNVDWDRDEKGAYMIDRDPVYFQVVLNYLRYGRLVMHRDIPEEAILIEAEYFNLPDLIKAVKQRMNNRPRWTRQANSHCGHNVGQPMYPNTNPPGGQPHYHPLVPQAANMNINSSNPYGLAPVHLQGQQNPQTLSAAGGDQPGYQLVGKALMKQPQMSVGTASSNQLAQQQQQVANQPSRVAGSSSMCSLLNQPEYLANYVNNILEDDIDVKLDPVNFNRIHISD